MKKRLPLVILVSVIGVVVAAVIVYLTYFGSSPISPPGPQIPESAKKGPGKAEAKRPGMARPGTHPDSAEKMAASVIAYEYNANDRRDPFATLIVKGEVEKRKGASPLESYDVSKFKLTAVLWSKSVFFALVSAPDGKNYTLRDGTTIGLYRGNVHKITKDSVVVTEFLKDYRGNVKPKNTVLKLHREEE